MGLTDVNVKVKKSDPDRTFLDQAQKWYDRSSEARTQHDERWASNIKLVKGQFKENEMERSKVRKRSKLFFRKIWATGWRLVASFYSAFLRDRDTFTIEGRDTLDDPRKAKVLHFMTEYRRDKMMRDQSLFLKFIWGFRNIIDLGWAVGKLKWEYNPEYGKDGPEFTLYPNEQVFPDFTAGTKEEMNYIIFENYLTSKDEMEEFDYDNIDKVEMTSVPSNIVRQARYLTEVDSLQQLADTAYPGAGAYTGDDTKDDFEKVYITWEIFHKRKGEIMLTVTNRNKVILKKTTESPYGDRYPCVMGLCLTEAHKLIGEGFPEPLEGPQESYNANINMRKDNVALALNKGSIVSRYGNVDLKSLVNSRPGGITLADDVNAVKEREMGDVTQSSYMEAQQDDGMMQEMSGIVPGKLGMETATKATVAQINYAESNAKIDLYTAIVAETFIKDFYSLLAYYIQRFETDERVFRVANEALLIKEKDDPFNEDVYDLDFEADCVINVGLGTVSREMEIKNALLAMDRAIMANTAMANLVKVGGVPPDGLRFIDATKIMEDILPKLGKKDLDRYFFTVEQGQGQQQWPGQNPALAGRTAAGLGQTEMPTESQQQQAGGFGGI